MKINHTKQTNREILETPLSHVIQDKIKPPHVTKSMGTLKEDTSYKQKF